MWFGEQDAANKPSPHAKPEPDERWQKAEIEKNAGVVEIRGAIGMFGPNWTNGIYDLDPERMSFVEPPAWQLRSQMYDRWLYFDLEHRWRVGSMEYKLKRKAAAGSICSEPVEPGTLPSDAKEWCVRMNYSDWESQDLKVRARPPKLGEDVVIQPGKNMDRVPVPEADEEPPPLENKEEEPPPLISKEEE
uniref:Uncharacterized protein n=1 Tax=Alexandrium monilatum TaxID=311494 RepID=A0A7S4V0E8_9DINO|mmetsp:Transcript_48705/g.145512  ORF Transcript_48705/g.145512 Transcript_48705/m.145512 type:complete len:190 (+) Transcript_48705:75-644(+)